MNSFTPHNDPELVLFPPLYRKDKWGIYKEVYKLDQHPKNSSGDGKI